MFDIIMDVARMKVGLHCQVSHKYQIGLLGFWVLPSRFRYSNLQVILLAYQGSNQRDQW